jgi:hypothetical protein
MLEYGCVPTLLHLTAKLVPSVVSEIARSIAVCTICGIFDVVCTAGDVEEIPKTCVRREAVSTPSCVFMYILPDRWLRSVGVRLKCKRAFWMFLINSLS